MVDVNNLVGCYRVDISNCFDACRCSCSTGDDLAATSLDAVMTRREGLLEKSVSEWVKAAVESSLGHRGCFSCSLSGRN